MPVQSARSALRTLSITLGAAVATAAWYGCGGSEPPPEAPTPGPAYRQAIEIICDVDRRAGLSDEEAPLEIGQKRSAWIAEHVEEPDAIYFRTMLSVKGPQEQSRMLRDEARKVGVARCALADSLQRDGTGGISP